MENKEPCVFFLRGSVGTEDDIMRAQWSSKVREATPEKNTYICQGIWMHPNYTKE